MRQQRLMPKPSSGVVGELDNEAQMRSGHDLA